MPRSRFFKLEPERREAILAAAAAEFAERGYEGASLNRLIERAGISKGALYYYFDDKEDLFATALEEATARVLAEVGWGGDGCASVAEYWQAWRDLTERSLELLREDHWYARLFRAFGRFQDEPVARGAWAKLLERKQALSRDLLERGQELGAVRTDLPLDLLVEAAAAAGEASGRWLLRRWDDLTDEERRQLLEARLDLVRDMLDAKHMGWDR
jgi:AcrR family transcriptional regulator